MEVEYELTVDDLLAVRNYNRSRQSDRSGILRSPWFLWVVAILVIELFLLLQAENPGLPLVFGFGALLGVFIFFGVLLADAKRKAARDAEDPRMQRWRGPWRFAISDEGVALTSDLTRTFERWPVVWRVDATAEFILFWTGRDEFHIVPRRAFRDDQHYQQFIDRVRQYFEQSKTSPALTRQPD